MFKVEEKVTKISILADVSHMDGGHSDQEKEEVVSDFLQKLADSGYKHPTRKEIMTSALRKYYRQIHEQKTGGNQLYCSS